MTTFLTANIAPLMFLGLVVFMLLGYPVAFALAAVGLLFGLLGIQLGLLPATLFQALPDRIWGVMSNETLLAIPFFTLMGLILERSGMAEDLLDTAGEVFGSLRGGLAYAVIFVGALLAATTGVVAASVISMGLISLPIMLRYGYDRRLASGVIAASGTLAQIIPPSLVLIVLGDQLGRSVGDMYAGAILPGLMLTGLYVLYVFLVTVSKPHWAPGLPPEASTTREADGRRGLGSLFVVGGISLLGGTLLQTLYKAGQAPTDERMVVTLAAAGAVALLLALINRALKLKLLSRLAERFIFVLIPPLALIFLVLGTIFLGIASPTEGGAMGAVGALLMALARKRLDRTQLSQALQSTVKLTAFVMFILIGARIFSLTFYGVNGHVWVEELLAHLPGGQTGFLIAVMLLVFVLAFFLDFFELAFIIVPLLAPVAEKLGIDLVWFGVLLAVNMQTSFMHPPFGFALFYLRSVAPAQPFVDRVTGRTLAPVTTGQIYRGAIPFVVIQLVAVGLVMAFPQMVMVYKDPAPQDAPRQEIIIPQGDTTPPDDLMKALGQPDKPETPEKQEKPERAEKAEAGKSPAGKPEPPKPAPKKTPEELEAEAIEKALRGEN